MPLAITAYLYILSGILYPADLLALQLRYLLAPILALYLVQYLLTCMSLRIFVLQAT